MPSPSGTPSVSCGCAALAPSLKRPLYGDRARSVSRCSATVGQVPRMRNDRKAATGRACIVNSSTPRPPSSACNAQRVAPTRLRVTLCASAPLFDVSVLTARSSGQKLLMEATARADYAPQGTDSRPSLFATVKRTFTEFSEDNMTDWAAALTYYGLLSLFPALIALVAIIGLVGDPATITRQVTDI